MAKKTVAKLCLDFPRRHEKVSSTSYAFRVGSNVDGPVEISIDDGPWQQCRPSVGYWWYDWHTDTQGKHNAVARVTQGCGTVTRTTMRPFSVTYGAKTAPKAKKTTRKVSSNGRKRKALGKKLT